MNILAVAGALVVVLLLVLHVRRLAGLVVLALVELLIPVLQFRQR